MNLSAQWKASVHQLKACDSVKAFAGQLRLVRVEGDTLRFEIAGPFHDASCHKLARALERTLRRGVNLIVRQVPAGRVGRFYSDHNIEKRNSNEGC